MTDYSTSGLDSFLNPINAPEANSGAVSSMDFDVLNDRNIIGATKLRDFSFSSGVGGTITLGGVDDGNGELVIKDSSGNTIVSGDSLGFHGYLTSGTESIRINGSGIQGYGLDGSTFAFYDVVGGTQAGQIGYLEAQSTLYIASTNSKSIIIDSDFEVQIDALDDALFRAVGIAQIQSTSSDVNIVSSGDVNIDTGGVLNVNGSPKAAIVPTSQGYKALYCSEAPEVWFFDFVGEDKVLDPLFLEATEGECKFIKVEGGGYQVWSRRRGFKNIRFAPKTAEEFTANNQFWSQAHPN